MLYFGPSNKIKHNIGKVFIATILVSLFAQLSIDVPISDYVVPISGQTFALFLVAWFLLPIEMLIAVLLYLLIGGMGLPVFADGSSGWQHLVGYTAGYLWMFLPASILVSYYRFSTTKHSFLSTFSILLFATALVLSVGAFVLAWKTNNPSLFIKGALPFIPGGVIKCFVGAVIIHLSKKHWQTNNLH